MRIPDDLVALLAHRRIIPFIGAGFSAVHNVPTWEKLLGALASEIQASSDIDPPLAYPAIVEACNGDNLQIAEYLYLIAGESIGPIRHGLSTALQSSKPLLDSTPHVELVNLGAPHVYTTNFDDLIEKTYRELGMQVDVIAVPRDMALSHADRTEIVKYHGDLRHEQTLVLTESQYYTRLEFESPMDLKFRSDLLGRSVLFMGYSFRDINIRVIWFRLMQMMKDVPLKDRPPSYIVRLRANPVLDALYESVGLRTLVIDPDGAARTTEEQNSLLAQFLLELSVRCSSDGLIPGSEQHAFVSVGLVQQAEIQLTEALDQASGPRRRLFRSLSVRHGRENVGEIVAPTPLLAAIDRLTARQITDFTAERVSTFLLEFARTINTVASRANLAAQLAAWFIPQRGGTQGVTLAVCRSMLRATSREVLLADESFPWSEVWAVKLTVSDVQMLLKAISDEIEGHVKGSYTDDDVAFAIDLAVRIAGEVFVESDNADKVDALKERVSELIDQAAKTYPAAKEYEPPQDAAPCPKEIQVEIERRVQALEKEAEEREEGES